MDIVGDIVVVEMDNTTKVRPKTAAFPKTSQWCPLVVLPLVVSADRIVD